MKAQIRDKVSIADVRSLGIHSMTIHKAYLESDIVWNNLKKSRAVAIIKRTLFFLLLVVFSFVILTPTYAVELLNPLRKNIEKQVDTTLGGFIEAYFTPIISLCINFGIIPFLIDMSTEMEDFRR